MDKNRIDQIMVDYSKLIIIKQRNCRYSGLTLTIPRYAKSLLRLILRFSICLEDNYKPLESALPIFFFLIRDRWTESITYPLAQHTAGGNNYMLDEVAGLKCVWQISG